MMSHLKEATAYAFKKLGQFFVWLSLGFIAFGSWFGHLGGVEKFFVLALIVFVAVSLFM